MVVITVGHFEIAIEGWARKPSEWKVIKGSAGEVELSSSRSVFKDTLRIRLILPNAMPIAKKRTDPPTVQQDQKSYLTEISIG